VQDRGEEGAGDVAGSGFCHRVEELARQLFSALRKGSESSEEQRIGIWHAVRPI